MTNALTLTASSLGRASQPGGAGAVLYVDGDNAVTIDAWPQPSRWLPDAVQLFRGDQEVRVRHPDDEWRWVLSGPDRFGVFRAVARAGETVVTSAPMLVQPTPVAVLAGAAEDIPGPQMRPSRSPSAGFEGGATPGALAGSGVGGAGLATDPGWHGGPGVVGAESAPGRAPGASSGWPPAGAAPSPVGSPTFGSAGSAGPEPVPSGPRTPAHASAADIAAMVEIPRGEYDGRFAALVAALFTVLGGGVLWYAATRLLGDPDLFATSTPPAEAVPPDAPAPFVRPANVAERIGLGTSTMVLALGVVVILAGAALAALEVRARMLRRARSGGGDSTGSIPSTAGSASHRGTTARGTPGALRHIAVIIDRISQPRAVIAVLVTGGSLVLVGFFGQLHWALRL